MFELSGSPARITPLDLTLSDIPLDARSSTFNPAHQPVINAGYINDHPGYTSEHPASYPDGAPPHVVVKQPCHANKKVDYLKQTLKLKQLPSIQSLSASPPDEAENSTPPHVLPSIQSLSASPPDDLKNSSPPHVVVKQPRRAITATESVTDGRPWSHGLFRCTDDRRICLQGTFCCPCLACRVSRDLEESAWVPCCVPYWLLVLRTKLRAHQDIAGSVMSDCCQITWCCPCVLCQVAREIDACQAEGQM
ncbi:hypothetical protein EGW08_004194 [Elysia chlorotica]|uniref:Uncharacterized protein n=1 Tax=Elysia chlorotica TaxID=188477 RepID=A0A433U2P6_ELYCH|nr:hypothetical protein EGW08_004194 [Elysia chlorotica]